MWDITGSNHHDWIVHVWNHRILISFQCWSIPGQGKLVRNLATSIPWYISIYQQTVNSQVWVYQKEHEMVRKWGTLWHPKKLMDPARSLSVLDGWRSFGCPIPRRNPEQNIPLILSYLYPMKSHLKHRTLQTPGKKKNYQKNPKYLALIYYNDSFRMSP